MPLSFCHSRALVHRQDRSLFALLSLSLTSVISSRVADCDLIAAATASTDALLASRVSPGLPVTELRESGAESECSLESAVSLEPQSACDHCLSLSLAHSLSHSLYRSSVYLIRWHTQAAHTFSFRSGGGLGKAPSLLRPTIGEAAICCCSSTTHRNRLETRSRRQ